MTERTREELERENQSLRAMNRAQGDTVKLADAANEDLAALLQAEQAKVAALSQVLRDAHATISPMHHGSLWLRVNRVLAGTGPQPASSDEFYLLDARTIVGNCASWWCPEGKGYTCELDKAGIYSRAEALRHRDTDVPVPRTLVESLAIRHVRLDWLRDKIDVRNYPESKVKREAWCAAQGDAYLESAPTSAPPGWHDLGDGRCYYTTADCAVTYAAAWRTGIRDASPPVELPATKPEDFERPHDPQAEASPKSFREALEDYAMDRGGQRTLAEDLEGEWKCETCGRPLTQDTVDCIGNFCRRPAHGGPGCNESGDEAPLPVEGAACINCGSASYVLRGDDEDTFDCRACGNVYPGTFVRATRDVREQPDIRAQIEALAAVWERWAVDLGGDSAKRLRFRVSEMRAALEGRNPFTGWNSKSAAEFEAGAYRKPDAPQVPGADAGGEQRRSPTENATGARTAAHPRAAEGLCGACVQEGRIEGCLECPKHQPPTPGTRDEPVLMPMEERTTPVLDLNDDAAVRAYQAAHPRAAEGFTVGMSESRRIAECEAAWKAQDPPATRPVGDIRTEIAALADRWRDGVYPHRPWTAEVGSTEQRCDASRRATLLECARELLGVLGRPVAFTVPEPGPPQDPPATRPGETIVPTRSAEFALKAAGMWEELAPATRPPEDFGYIEGPCENRMPTREEWASTRAAPTESEDEAPLPQGYSIQYPSAFYEDGHGRGHQAAVIDGDRIKLGSVRGEPVSVVRALLGASAPDPRITELERKAKGADDLAATYWDRITELERRIERAVAELGAAKLSTWRYFTQKALAALRGEP